MLKIKDNVDLKELEKFGFELNSKEWFEKDANNGYLYVKPISKEIVYSPVNTARDIECNDLYDLIQAGLVEKVEDER